MIVGHDPDVLAALSQPNVIALYALKIDAPSGVSRWHSGLGPLVIGGEVYYGVGNMGAVSPQREQLSTSPNKLNVSLAALDDAMLAMVMNERLVGRLAWLYLVVLSPDEVPLKASLQFKGRIAQTPVKVGPTNTIALTISNIFEEWQKGLNKRCTDESHKRDHPGDRFFVYQSEMADRTIYWGSEKDAPRFVYKD